MCQDLALSGVYRNHWFGGTARNLIHRVRTCSVWASVLGTLIEEGLSCLLHFYYSNFSSPKCQLVLLGSLMNVRSYPALPYKGNLDSRLQERRAWCVPDTHYWFFVCNLTHCALPAVYYIPFTHDWNQSELHKPVTLNPSWWQATMASLLSHRYSHTVPQTPTSHISRRPLKGELPSLSLKLPSSQSEEGNKKHKINQVRSSPSSSTVESWQQRQHKGNRGKRQAIERGLS